MPKGGNGKRLPGNEADADEILSPKRRRASSRSRQGEVVTQRSESRQLRSLSNEPNRKGEVNKGLTEDYKSKNGVNLAKKATKKQLGKAKECNQSHVESAINNNATVFDIRQTAGNSDCTINHDSIDLSVDSQYNDFDSEPDPDDLEVKSDDDKVVAGPSKERNQVAPEITLGGTAITEQLVNNPQIKQLLEKMVDEKIKAQDSQGEQGKSHTPVWKGQPQQNITPSHKQTNTNNGMILAKSPSDTTLYAQAFVSSANKRNKDNDQNKLINDITSFLDNVRMEHTDQRQ